VAKDQPDAAGAVRAAYHAVLDAAVHAQDRVVAEHGREPWGAAGVLRHPDFDAPAAGPLIDAFDFDRGDYESEVAITRTAAAALREAGTVQKLAELTRAVQATASDAVLDLSGTSDARARDAYRMLACLAVDAELRTEDDAYITVIAGLDAMARAQFYAAGQGAAVSNLMLLRFTDSLVLDAIAARNMSQERARALLHTARVATDALRERYLNKLSPELPPEGRSAMASFWHITRDARRLALAIEVHRREHGALPAVLDDLVPGVLAEMPRDPHAANPHAEHGGYVYRLDGANPFGYVLYSVGPDGIDDGGVRRGNMPRPEPGTDQVLVPEG
jgi:hypothetical protein